MVTELDRTGVVRQPFQSVVVVAGQPMFPMEKWVSIVKGAEITVQMDPSTGNRLNGSVPPDYRPGS
jgi:hypothetical protein